MFCLPKIIVPTFRRNTLGLLLLALLILFAVSLFLNGSAGGQDQGPAPADETPPSVGDFDACVRLALRQSPYLTKTSLEIEVKRLDETDSRFQMVPPVSFRTYYFVNRPTRQDLNPRAYSLQFVTDPYNPFEAYFTFQARKLITDMAIQAHLQIISDGLQRLGRIFLELESLGRLVSVQGDLLQVARQYLAYTEKRLSLGTGTSLEVKLAAQEMELVQAEKERLLASQRLLVENLRSFLGIKPSQEFTPDFKEARRQVLGQFDPAGVGLEQVMVRSHELKIQELKKQLQSYLITQAKTKLLPSILFGVQTPDPLSLTDARGLYFSVGLEVPVWDGFTRWRNITRQKTILKQFGAERDVKEMDLSGKWRTALEEWRAAGAARKMAQAQEELGRLKERQGEIRYHSGGEQLPVFLDGRKGHLETQKLAVRKSLEYDLTVLNLRHLSGDLDHSYVQASSWHK
jgi:outer membrane protein TolC